MGKFMFKLIVSNISLLVEEGENMEADRIEEFFEACRKGDIESVKQMLNEGIDPTANNNNGMNSNNII